MWEKLIRFARHFMFLGTLHPCHFVMFKYILLFVLNFAICESCSTFCKFLWDNTTGNSSQLRVPYNSEGLGIKGIITIDGNLNQNPDISPTTGDQYQQIRFRKSLMDEPMFLTYMVKNGTGENVLHVQASYAQTDTLPAYEVTNPFQNNKINLQVSDLTADTLNYYSLYTNTSAILNKCNFGSEAEWNRIYGTNNLKLSDTDEILTGLNTGPHTFNYLSVCTSSTPTICSISHQNPILGTDFNLTCQGSGAPYLTVSWDTDKTVAMTTHPVVYNTSISADHEITSVLTLSDFSLRHEGNYTCTVKNINFLTSTSQLFTVKYTQPVSVTFLSENTFLSSTVTALQWTVTGWPLDNLKLNCNASQTNYTISISMDTPQGNFIASFNTTSDIVACRLTNSENASVSMTTVYRVGMNCSKGEYGLQSQCLECPLGWTSLPGSDSCFLGNTSCSPGLYYSEKGCEACPSGEMSDKGAVKIQECYTMISVCPIGQYDTEHYGLLYSCVDCPWGLTSYEQSVKPLDCFRPKTNCSTNFYFSLDLENGSKPCVLCPHGTISQIGAAKQQDCRDGNSSCPLNFYGIAVDCNVCPRGKLSPPNSVKEEECEAAQSQCRSGSWGTTTCQLCPWGESSQSGTAVKPQDCYGYPADKSCPEGQYNAAQCATCTMTCVNCPANHTSKPGAAKLEDCAEMESNCAAGFYGYEDNCLPCPPGYDSSAGSKTKEQCVETRISPQVVFVIGVIVVMVMLGLIMVGTFLRFKLKQRRQRSGMRAVFSNRENDNGTLIVKNHFAD